MHMPAWLLPLTLACVAALVKLTAMGASLALHRVFLYPLALFLSGYTGEGFIERAGGFYFTDFYLDYSCAGINFFVIAALTAALLISGRDVAERRKLSRVLLEITLLLSAVYAVTLIANFTRVALYIDLQPYAPGRPWLHEAIGIIVFLSVLSLFSLSLNRIIHAPQSSNS